MNFRYIFFLIIINYTIIGTTQNANEDVLFTVDTSAVSASEFIRVYNKNLNLVQDESPKNIDNYLKLFVDYKLKIREAKALQLDKKPSYLSELETYTKQLAKSYMSDSKVTEDLVIEAFDRVSHEIKASHILVRISENASPEDSLKAFNKITTLRNRAIKEGFEKTRKAVHDGKTIYGEELGYFSGFKMVYPFETVAYNTPVDSISAPFRTQFGYHFLKVQDKRKSQGKVTVAHIMVLAKKDDSLLVEQEEKINMVYQKLQGGASFEDLAKTYSEDRNSASLGGKLAPFTRGQLNVPEFEKMAFSLQAIGEMSKPVKTKYGWHILKLIRKEPIKPFEELRPELIDKIKRDSRSKLIDKALYDNLRKMYAIEKNVNAIEYFTSLISSSANRKITLPENYNKTEPLFKIEDKTFNYQDFGSHLETNVLIPEGTTNLEAYIQRQYEDFLNAKLVAFHKSNLIHINPDYAAIIQEYQEGLLLFDLMETTIWNTNREDSLAIKSYYDEHKSNYVTPAQLDGVVMTTSNLKMLKKVSKLFKSGMDLDHVKALVNTESTPNVTFKSDTFSVKDKVLPERFQIKKGLSKIYNEKTLYSLVYVSDILPETEKPFEKVRGAVQSDYQEQKEKLWLNALAKKYKVTINEGVLKDVKRQLQTQ